jgi:hypothetical protein
LRKATISFVMSVRPFIRLSAWNHPASTGEVFRKFYILVFFENLARKFKLHLNLRRITGTFHEDLCTFMIISPLVFLRIRNVSEKRCRKNRNTNCMFRNFFSKIVPFVSYVAKYGTARQPTDDNTIWCMPIACWITNATNTHSEYVILIAFPRQQLLHERVSVLRST